MRIDQALRFLHGVAKQEGLSHYDCMRLREKFKFAHLCLAAHDYRYDDWTDSAGATLRANVLSMKVGKHSLRATFHDRHGNMPSNSKRAHRKTGVSIEFPFRNGPE